VSPEVLVLGGTYDPGAFAPTADTVVQALRAQGLAVEYGPGDSTRISLRKSADWWGPTLLLIADTLRAGGIELFVNGVMDALRETRPDPSSTVAHCRVGRRITASEDERWMEYDGPADALPDAIRALWSEESS
jgi:hypothetical protein